MKAGRLLMDIRTPAIAFAVAAVALGAGAAGSVGAAGPTAAERPGGDPPTAAEVRRATKRFLAGRAEPEVAGAGPATRAGAQGAGSRPLFPRRRVVSFYGAPQLTQTIVGRLSPARAARRLRKQAAAYRGRNRRPVTRSFDLIGVIATASAGGDGKYRTRQSPRVIKTYLARARRINARLMLDIQPGRANVLAEFRALRRWLRKPDVDVAIDPEWNVGRRGVPGRTQGSISAKRLNRFSLRLQRMIARRGMPPKILAVHQFRSGSIRNRGRVRQRRDVAVTLNFDGIGSPAAKRAGYRNLSVRRLHDGFSLFYRRDDPLMRPRAVLRLEPEPDFVLYQ